MKDRVDEVILYLLVILIIAALAISIFLLNINYSPKITAEAVASGTLNLTILDQLAPNITNPNANETSITQNNYFCLNVTVDDNGAIGTVYAEVNDQTTTTNNTMTDTGSTSCDGASSDDIFGVNIQGTLIANYTYQAVFANDSSGNSTYSDFTDIYINVTEGPPSEGAAGGGAGGGGGRAVPQQVKFALD